MPVRILHAADLHMDSPFEGLPAEKAALRRREQRELLGAIAALAESRGVDAVLLAGDLLDSASAYPETLESLERSLAGLAAPVFISPGNHDFYAPSSPWAHLTAGGVHVFTSPRPQCVPLRGKNARIWGAGFTSASSGPLLRGFQAEKEVDTVDIMLMHGQVGAPDGAYNPISPEDIRRSGMDYIALGHVHSFGGLRREGDTFYAWPGCPEGRGFDETGEKGVIVAEVSPGGTDAEFVPLGGRKYERLEVDITNSDDIIQTVTAALPPETGRDIYRLILAGERESQPDMRALREALEARFFQLQLRDATVFRRDVWAKCGEDTLRGLFLTLLRRKYDAARSDGERERYFRAARWGLRAMDNGEDIL